MKVSIDGLRRSATASMNVLAKTIESLINNLPENQAEELINDYNQAAQYVDIFNCVYSNNIEMFNDLSNEIEVKKLDENLCHGA